jgi:hypothetical protein
LLAVFGISGLQIRSIHSFAPTRFRKRIVLPGVNECRQTSELIFGKVKVRHTFVRASIAHNGTYLVSIHIRSD